MVSDNEEIIWVPSYPRKRVSRPISAWIPSRIAVRDKLFNGMTDHVRHLDSRVRGNDESSRWHREGIPAIFILRGRA